MNTKNIAFFGLGLFCAAALASCDNIEDSLSSPITNPQLPIFNAEGLNFIAFPYIDASNPEAMPIDTVGYCSVKLPEGFTLGGTFQLSPTQDFSTVIEAPITADGSYLFVSVADLAAQYSDKISLNPITAPLYARTILTAAKGAEVVRIGGSDTYFGAEEYKFTPVAPQYEISRYYYLVPGDGTNWSFDSAVRLSHSDVNQYDDPVFTVLLTKEFRAGDRWILMPTTSYVAALKAGSLAGVEYLVPIYDRTDNGTVYGDLDKQNSGNFDPAKMPALNIPCEISFNARTNTYTSKTAVVNYYVTGNGWPNWGEHWMPLFTTDYLNYTGFLNLGTEFKFSPTNAWSGDFGAAEAPAESENNGIYSYTGTCHDSSNNITIAHEGLYFANLNVTDWSYSLSQIKSWGLIGDFNGWSGDIAMTPSDDLYTWTAELTVAEGQGWKFRANSDWAVNLGGTADALWNNGDNIVLPAGTYTVTLDLTTYPAKYTAVKK